MRHPDKQMTRVSFSMAFFILKCMLSACLFEVNISMLIHEFLLRVVKKQPVELYNVFKLSWKNYKSPNVRLEIDHFWRDHVCANLAGPATIYLPLLLHVTMVL